MMTQIDEQIKVLLKISKVDLMEEDDWSKKIINDIENCFARGYLTAVVNYLKSEEVDEYSEEFRRELETAAGYNSTWENVCECPPCNCN